MNGYTIGWTDAGVVVPYVLWRRFGDAAVIRENWESMARYMAYVAEKGARAPQPFGDWLSYEYGADMEWLKPTRVKQQLPRKRFLSAARRRNTPPVPTQCAVRNGTSRRTEAICYNFTNKSK